MLTDMDPSLEMMDIDDFTFSSDTVADTYFNDDVQALTQWWINERCAPELLPYQKELVLSLMEMLDAQASNVEENAPDTPDGAFLVVLYQQEMERIKFVIRSYLRTRLSKIQKYTMHLLRDPEYRGRLSEEELRFAEKFQELLERHFMKACLEELPPPLQRLDDETSDISMVSKPDLEDAVFCQVKEDIGVFQLDDSGETIDMRTNNIYILRYKAIRRFLEENKVDLV